MNFFRRINNFVKIQRLESCAILPIVIAVFLVSIGFWFGIPCGRWQLVVGIAVSLLLAGMRSLRNLSCLLLIYICCIIISAFTFSYIGTDSVFYHAPVQRLLSSGWNPIFQSSIEDVSRLTNGGCLLYHVLFLPHFHHLVGSLVAKTTGLFLADTFFSYLMLFVLGCASYRFARLQWPSASKIFAVIFAAFVAFPTKISTIFSSMLDYSLYALLAVGILSYMSWLRSRDRDDLFLVFATLSCSALMKFTGLLCVGLLLGYIGIRHRQCRSIWLGLLISAIFITVVGTTPYLTAWVRYGSPLYPIHTFNPLVRVVDITNDFTANADGLSMGYISRIIYAWFSKKLAITLCAWKLGNPTFNPEFYVAGGVDGLKLWFRPMMWFAVVALMVSKKNRITILCGVLFILSNLAPIKYIGYSRYFMLIWMIPPLATYNMIFNPISHVDRLLKFVQYPILIGMVLMTVSVLAKSVGHYAHLMAMESYRQKEWKEIEQKGLPISIELQPSQYLLFERVTQTRGLSLQVEKESDEIIKIDSKGFVSGASKYDVKSLQKDFPVCNNLQELLHFNWLKLASMLPHPIFEK